MGSLAANLADLHGRMARASESVGRDPSSLTLVAVSKTRPVEDILTAYELGVRDFGESRLQEAIPKMERCPADIRWHFIGTMQTNKARQISERFAVVHTLSTDRQAAKMCGTLHPVDSMIEVNIAEEAKKSGVSLNQLDGLVADLLEYRQAQIRGLMTIGPALDDPEAMRPYFRTLREAAERFGLHWLSMGMSHDFEVAIQEGSTHIRVGSLLFGVRQ